MTRTRALFAALSLFTAFAAAADLPNAAPGAPGHWSVVTGETVSPDRDAITFELGWPGASFSYLHGTSDRSDLAMKVHLLYERENTTDSAFGAGFDVPFRLVVSRSGKVSILLQVEPGVRLYTQNGTSDFMTRFPLGGVLGIQVTPEVRLAGFAGLTMAVNWTHTTFFEVGPQFGVGVEYFVDKNLLVGLSGKFGPQFYSFSNSPTDFAFTTQLVAGYRM
jgi:hypothetical protein